MMTVLLFVDKNRVRGNISTLYRTGKGMAGTRMIPLRYVPALCKSKRYTSSEGGSILLFFPFDSSQNVLHSDII